MPALAEVREWLVREQGYTPEQALAELPDAESPEYRALTGRKTAAPPALPDREWLKCSGRCGRVRKSSEMNAVVSKHGRVRPVCGECIARRGK